MSQDECDEMKVLLCTLADTSLHTRKNERWQQKVDLRKRIEHSTGKDALIKVLHDAIRQQMDNGCTIDVTVTAIQKLELHHGVLVHHGVPYSCDGKYHFHDNKYIIQDVIQHLRLEGWDAYVRSNYLGKDVMICGTLLPKKLFHQGKFSLERGKFFLWKEKVLKSL